MFNLLRDIANVLPEEQVDAVLRADNLRIERIVSRGHSSPEGFWYDQDEHEWLCLIQGDAVIEFADGESVSMAVGDCQLIDAHRRHRVAVTCADIDTIWLAVFFLGNLRDVSRDNTSR